MQRAVALSIHVAHLVLLVLAALAGIEERPLERPSNPVQGGLSGRPSVPGDTAPSAGAIRCPMPVSRADASVSYAMLVVRPGPPVAGLPAPTPCVNRQLRAVAR